jgi:hypothetical protein
MNQSIIEAAITNKTLRLELTYRAFLMLREEDDDTAELEIPTGDLPMPHVQPVSGEFACLLSVL